MLEEILGKYLKLFPKDEAKLGLLKKQIANKEQLNSRKNFMGHIAGDAIILSPDLKRVLLVFHLHRQRWQQPGGHWDEDETGPWLTAERETYEETGVKIAKRLLLVKDDPRVPLHICSVEVQPHAGKGEPFHWHHNFVYGYIAVSQNLGKIQDEGVKAAKWFKVDGNFFPELQEGIDRTRQLAANQLKA